jgi:hypothetical protein
MTLISVIFMFCPSGIAGMNPAQHAFRLGRCHETRPSSKLTPDFNARHELGSAVEITDDQYACARDADALVISTDWDDFKSPDYDRLAKTMKSPVIFDGRNLYRPSQMREHGFTYYSIGRAAVKPG